MEARIPLVHENADRKRVVTLGTGVTLPTSPGTTPPPQNIEGAAFLGRRTSTPQPQPAQGEVHGEYDPLKMLLLPDPSTLPPITLQDHLISEHVKTEKPHHGLVVDPAATAAARQLALDHLSQDIKALLFASQTSARQVATAHQKLTSHCQDHVAKSLATTAKMTELQLQAATYTEFHANAATNLAGTLASQVLEMSEMMHKSKQLLVDIARCHRALDELDLLMDDMERLPDPHELAARSSSSGSRAASAVTNSQREQQQSQQASEPKENRAAAAEGVEPRSATVSDMGSPIGGNVDSQGDSS
jgi:hypothetical protein